MPDQQQATAQPPNRKLKLIAAGAAAGVLALLILLVAIVGLRRHNYNPALPVEADSAAGVQVQASRPSPAGPAVAVPPSETPEQAKEEEAAPDEGTSHLQSGTQPATSAPATEDRRSPDASVTVKTTPDAVDLLFDNSPRLACKSPCTMALSSGRHSVSAKLEGYRPALRIFSLPEESEFTLHLARMTGEVLVVSEPAGAVILVDGTRRRETTPATIQVAAGKHTISLNKDGYMRHEQEIEVKDSAFVRLSVNLGKRDQ